MGGLAEHVLVERCETVRHRLVVNEASGAEDDALRANIPTFDISNMQVVKRPQGTLFGRNSMGGAVLVYSRQATKAQSRRREC